MSIGLYNSDCIEKMQELIDKGIQVDSIVTDPPYELGFMGKDWDSTGIAYRKETWELALKLLKPGGHLLSFGGSRTYHRMAVAIEDAGFEIRDQIMWLYGSGFPKSLNIGKAVDKKLGNDREVIRIRTDGNKGGGVNTYDDDNYIWNTPFKETKGSSPYEGWGTALKPAHEPIVMARKPLSEKTVADNVLKHGAGGINIDECRIETKDKTQRVNKRVEWGARNDTSGNAPKVYGSTLGRYPANVMHDGGEEVVSEFPNSGSAARFFYCPKASRIERDRGLDGFEDKIHDTEDYINLPSMRTNSVNTSSGELRKVNPAKNTHPTVKPIELMKYLCRLVTPKGGTVLDMFMGSGTTGIAAKKEGFNFIGIENETDYFKIAAARISHDTNKTTKTSTKDSSQVKQPSFNDLIDWSD